MFLNRQDPGLENYGKTDDKFISVNISYIIAELPAAIMYEFFFALFSGYFGELNIFFS